LQKYNAKKQNPYAGEAGFRLELEVLSKYRHPHLVELIGYCVDKQLLKATKCNLVLEFMAEGSLLDRLRPDHAAPALAAQERFDIAADVARGLHYLHAEASPPLIHQDVKSDNVLLAEIGGRLVAKVADFGTARMAPQLAMNTTACAPGGGGGKTHHSTMMIVGTRPYMPMEYIQMGRVSEKTDTFAYGVVLLELLTGKPPHDEEGGTNEALHSFAHEMLCDPAGKLVPLLDARVAAASWTSVDGATGELGGRALWLCLVAKRCLELAERTRGTMREARPKVVALAAAAAAAAAAAPTSTRFS
jgi:serine/threonine protein kinase